MTHVQNIVDKFKTKRNEVKEALEPHYGSIIYNPFDSGSFKKHTAIKQNLI